MRVSSKLRQSVRAFTLTEISVVMLIIGILTALAIPSFISIQQNTELSSGVQIIVDNLNLARQTALAQNRSIEFRFFKFKKGQLKREGYRSVCYYLINEETDKEVPQIRMQYLPDSVMLSNDPKNKGDSTLLWVAEGNGVAKSPFVGQMEIPGLGNTEYIAFRFRPNGSTDLPSFSPSDDTWFVTIQKQNENDKPKNFYVVQLDPHTGKTKVIR